MPSDENLAPYQGIPRPTRRALLRSGQAAAVTSVGAGLASSVGLGPVEEWSPSPDTWPLADYDPARTAHSPGTAPPRDSAVDWIDNSLASRTGSGVSLVVGSERVYATGLQTAAFNRADGSVAWTADVNGADLALHDGRLFIAGDIGPTLCALNPSDGTQLWTATPDDQGIALTVSQGTVFLGGSTGVYAYTPDGGRKWTDGDRWADSLAVVGGRLLARADGLRAYRRRTLLDIPLRSPPGTAWRTSAITQIVGTDSGTEADLALGFCRRREEVNEPALTVADPGSGTAQWRALGHDEYPTRTAVGALATGSIRCFAYFATRDPTTRALGAYRFADGTRDWRIPVDNRVVDLAVTGTTVLVGTAGPNQKTGSLYALNPIDGTERWRVSLDSPVDSLAPVDGTVFFGTLDERVFAVR